LGWDTLGQRDIRKIRAHLDGGPDLVTGDYQADVLRIARGGRTWTQEELTG
jgi:hypothetical protein